MKLQKRLRWVGARLNCPEICGDRFTFTVEDFGHFFEDEKENERESVSRAVRLYLDTALFALKIAIGVRNDRNAGSIPLPLPASGRFVKIGKEKLDQVLSFCASPIDGAARIPNSTNTIWKITQGDLFRGQINLRSILHQSQLTFLAFTKTNTETAQVLVKVSSTAVHDLLINPSDSTAALYALERLTQRQPELMNEIGSVLYGAVSTQVGLVTIMADLSLDRYETLRPQSDDGKRLFALWTGFKDLVERVLLPMADQKIIHPDIRPGYDITFNILCQMSNDGTRATMKLIDLEGLVFVTKWSVPVVNGVMDGRFVPTMGDCDATTYVWWQCVFVAYVWSEKIAADDVGKAIGNKGTVMNILQDVLFSKHNPNVLDPPDWLVHLLGYNVKGDMDATCVRETLTHLGKLFDCTS